ncbi:hypothetical protein ACP4OV_031959 [Aristida adscensionis]
MDKLQHRHEERSDARAVARRRRGVDGEPARAVLPRRAHHGCPCLVVNLLWLALVKALLAMACRCLRRQWGELRHKKHMCDLDTGVGVPRAWPLPRGVPATIADASPGADGCGEASTRATSSSSSGRLDAKKAWRRRSRGNKGERRGNLGILEKV